MAAAYIKTANLQLFIVASIVCVVLCPKVYKVYVSFLVWRSSRLQREREGERERERERERKRHTNREIVVFL